MYAVVKETESFLTTIRERERCICKRQGEERKEETAEVSNSNKSSNAEQFFPVLSWSVDPISNPKKGLCLVALAVGRWVQSSDHPLPCSRPQRCSLSRRCLWVKLSWPVRGYFPAAPPRSVTTAWPPTSYSLPPSREKKSIDQLAWNGDGIEMNDYWANSYSSLYGAVISEKLNRYWGDTRAASGMKQQTLHFILL